MNTKGDSITLTVPPSWNVLHEIQKKAAVFLQDKFVPREIMEATVMCAIELVENAIKYGSFSDGAVPITFYLKTIPNSVTITVSNRIRNEDDISQVKTHIEKIRITADPGALFMERLREIMNSKKPELCRLGLYRIAHEGEFKLDFMFAGRVLTITAERTYTGQ